MAGVASDASNVTGREMRVSNSTIAVERVANGETGVVTLTTTWTNRPRDDGDRLVLTEPFASGYTADRTVTVRAPDGYGIVESSVPPEPNRRPRGE